MKVLRLVVLWFDVVELVEDKVLEFIGDVAGRLG